MRFLWILIILKATNAANDDSTIKNDLDPNDSEDNAFLWKHLFIKLNTMLSETDKLNKRFDDLSKGQEEQENRLTNFMENINKSIADVKLRHEEQENRLTTFMENINKSISYVKHGQQWTSILRRQDNSVNFNRNWHDYKYGFGDPKASFFIGLERLHAMTTYGSPQELLIVLIDYQQKTRYAKYDLFRVGSEDENYALTELGSFTGDAGDGMAHHRGRSFTTFDRDNNKGKIRDCPINFKGGWWFHEPCYIGFLNGLYRSEVDQNRFGVSWGPWRGWDYSLKYAEMKIR